MKICTQFEPPEVVLEYNSGESIVDIELYIPTDKRIENYIRSGENLEDTRRLQYHTDYLENMVNNPNWTDPLLYRGYDTADLEQLHREAIQEILDRRSGEDLSTSPQGSDQSDIGSDPVGPVDKSIATGADNNIDVTE